MSGAIKLSASRLVRAVENGLQAISEWDLPYDIAHSPTHFMTIQAEFLRSFAELLTPGSSPDENPAAGNLKPAL